MENESRRDDVLRLRLGPLQGDTDIFKRRRDTDRRTHVERTHTLKQIDHCEEQRRVTTARSIVGCI